MNCHLRAKVKMNNNNKMLMKQFKIFNNTN